MPKLSIKPTFWFDRKFPLQQLSPALYPNILERLTGTPMRLTALIDQIPAERYKIRLGDKWSIQEQVGHLLTLEPLWSGRIEDIRKEDAVIRSADLENKATDEAGFNDHSMKILLDRFRQTREALVKKFWEIEDADLQKSGLHPRLKEPMRLVDLAFFIAEHDDHHLAYIRYLDGQL